MKSVSTKHGGKPAAPGAEPRRSESQLRIAGARPAEARPRDHAQRSGEAARSAARPASERHGDAGYPTHERQAPRDGDEPRTGVVRRVESPGWRCLELGASPKPRLRRRRQANTSKVTIVQLSLHGDLIRQNGPDAWLPEAGDFMHRMSTLLARSLGFGSCRSLCLRGESAVLAVSAVGDSRVVAVSGPTR